MNNALHPARPSSARPRMLWRVGAVAIAGVTLLAACGGDDDASSVVTEAPAVAAASTEPPAPVDDGYGYGDPVAEQAPALAGAAAVATAEASVGTVLVDRDGLTLYAFTEDVAGEPTCVDGCAEAWPPAIVEGEPTFGDLDAALFTTVEHPEGTQLKAGDFPLYTFAGDAAPGDVNGQGSGDVWFAVTADATLID